MILLQENLTMTKEGMYVAAIGALVAVIVWLALYVRKLHSKTVEYLKEDKEVFAEIISKNTASAESQSRSNDRLNKTLDEVYKYMLTQNRRNP